MQLENSFSVPVGIDDAWKVLLDIERVVPCMPGAALDTVDGDAFTGSVKVKLGPIGLTYKGKASFIEKDEATHRAVIDAQGKDSRGNGTAAAKVTAVLTEEDGSNTRVNVTTDLNITGKPAQFGRGVMVDVGNKLIGQFADCLAGKLAAGEPVEEPAGGPATDNIVGIGESAPSNGTAPADAASSDAAPTGAVSADAGAAGEPSAPADVPAGAAAPAAQAAPAAAPTAPAVRSIAPQEVEPIDLLGSAGPAVLKRVLPLVGLAVALVVAYLLGRRK